MYVAYFDEVKPNPKEGQHRYLVGGVIVKMGDIVGIEAMMTELSADVFQSTELIPATEFHASYIYNKKGPFKEISAPKRLEIFRRIVTILSMREKVKLAYACINTDKLYSGTNPAEQAFMHFVERVHSIIEANAFAILIGDLDDQQAKNMVAEFSRYRTRGTNSRYGTLITRIVDSVHFCRSHHSRMIQLADAYVFTVSNLYSPRKGWMGEQFKKVLETANLFPNAYKEWPK